MRPTTRPPPPKLSSSDARARFHLAASIGASTCHQEHHSCLSQPVLPQSEARHAGSRLSSRLSRSSNSSTCSLLSALQHFPHTPENAKLDFNVPKVDQTNTLAHTAAQPTYCSASVPWQDTWVASSAPWQHSRAVFASHVPPSHQSDDPTNTSADRSLVAQHAPCRSACTVRAQTSLTPRLCGQTVHSGTRISFSSTSHSRVGVASALQCGESRVASSGLDQAQSKADDRCSVLRESGWCATTARADDGACSQCSQHARSALAARLHRIHAQDASTCACARKSADVRDTGDSDESNIVLASLEYQPRWRDKCVRVNTHDRISAHITTLANWIDRLHRKRRHRRTRWREPSP